MRVLISSLERFNGFFSLFLNILLLISHAFREFNLCLMMMMIVGPVLVCFVWCGLSHRVWHEWLFQWLFRPYWQWLRWFGQYFLHRNVVQCHLMVCNDMYKEIFFLLLQKGLWHVNDLETFIIMHFCLYMSYVIL